jgi:Holliday junction resolvasome RuvABC endonuclease subunit
MSVRVLGIDTGFVGTGLALVEWDGTTPRLIKWDTVKTSTTPKKRRLLVVDDHLRRIREIHRGIAAATVDPRPDVVAMEAFSQARNAAAAARQAFGYATAVVVCERSALPIIQFTPQDIHKRLGVPKRPPLPPAAPKGCTKEQKRAADRARKVASEANKTAVWVRACEIMPAPWAELTEHEADAACAALAALYPEPVDLVRACSGGTMKEPRSTVEPDHTAEGT